MNYTQSYSNKTIVKLNFGEDVDPSFKKTNISSLMETPTLIFRLLKSELHFFKEFKRFISSSKKINLL